MARSDNNLSAVFTDTANAIRSKTGTSSAICPRDFADEIAGISVGGADTAVDLLAGNIGVYSLPSEIGVTKPLSPYAFTGSTIIDVDLNNLDLIPSNCFSQCKLLQNVRGNEVKMISSLGFGYCNCLKNISFPKCLEIKPSAFTNDFDIETIELSNLVTIYNTVFSSCSKLSYFSAPNLMFAQGNNDIFGRCSLLTSIYMPNLISLSVSFGINVSQLTGDFSFSYLVFVGNNTFQYLSKMKDIYIPALPKVGTNFFSDCIELETINMLNVKNIFSNTFYNCKKLKEIYLPLINDNIPQSCFWSCWSMSKVEICAYGMSIQQNAFANCSSLSQLYILGLSLNLQNTNAFNSTPLSDSSLLGYYGSIYVPSQAVASFKAATNWVDYSARITALPSEFDSKYIYCGEFVSRSDLTTIPNEKLNCEVVGNSAFFNCSNIISIDLSKCKIVGRRAFQYCYRLANINLPECEILGEFAFSQCYSTSLSQLTFPKVKYIHNNAFSGVTSLRTLSIPECEILYSNAFSGLSSLSYVYCPKVKVICSSAFLNCSNISYISLPECLYIQQDGFGNCAGLTYIELPKVKVAGGFYNCTNLSMVSLPSAYKIDALGFVNCINLDSIYAPNLIAIGTNGLAGTKLSSFDFSNIVELGSSAFANTKLQKISLCNLNYIDGFAFNNISTLSKVLFTNRCYVSNKAFISCINLSNIYMLTNGFVELYSSNTFDSTPIANGTGSIYVPSTLLNAYQNDSIWSYYSSRFVGLTDAQIQDVIDHWDD